VLLQLPALQFKAHGVHEWSVDLFIKFETDDLRMARMPLALATTILHAVD